MQHGGIIMRVFLYFMALIAALATSYAIWTDLTYTYTASRSLGQLWYQNYPQSLQITETIVSRYIDPCGLVISFNCSPFLWHPTISTILGWPAALVFAGFTAIFTFLAERTNSPNPFGLAKSRASRKRRIH
jgi:hypothetical protein